MKLISDTEHSSNVYASSLSHSHVALRCNNITLWFTMKWSPILDYCFLLESDSPLHWSTLNPLHIWPNYDVLTSVTPAKFCQRLRLITSFAQLIASTKRSITVIKKIIQRNHMFAIFALLLEDAIFWLLTPSSFFSYPEYRFKGCLLQFLVILCIKSCSLLCNLNLLTVTLWVMKINAKHTQMAKYILQSIFAARARLIDSHQPVTVL